MTTLPQATPYYGGRQSASPVTKYDGSVVPSANIDCHIGDVYVNKTTPEAYICLSRTGYPKQDLWAAIAGGSGVRYGTTAAMVAGTTTVSTAAVAAGSVIITSVATPGGTQGDLSIGTIVAGTSFVINSSSSSDTSTVNWLIVT